jgi:hypothetical protein
MNDKKLTAVVLLDMSKAFDSLDHHILVSKLKDVVVSTEALKWFTSYLRNRSQRVRINSGFVLIRATKGLRSKRRVSACF